MKLICIACGNYTYWECDIQMFRLIKPTNDGLLLEDAVLDDFNWSDSTIRDELQDNVDYVLRASDEVLKYNADTGYYENTLITCARCGSKRVTPPYSKWRPKRNLKSVQEEILDNKEEFKQLRKDKTHANTLPVLWKSSEFRDPFVG